MQEAPLQKHCTVLEADETVAPAPALATGPSRCDCFTVESTVFTVESTVLNDTIVYISALAISSHAYSHGFRTAHLDCLWPAARQGVATEHVDSIGEWQDALLLLGLCDGHDIERIVSPRDLCLWRAKRFRTPVANQEQTGYDTACAVRGSSKMTRDDLGWRPSCAHTRGVETCVATAAVQLRARQRVGRTRAACIIFAGHQSSLPH